MILRHNSFWATLPILGFCILLTVTSSALAGESVLETLWDRVHEPTSQQSELGLGAGVAYTPEFQGADENELVILPMVTLRNFHGFNLRPFKLSYDLIRIHDDATGRPSLVAGPQISVDLGRDEDDSRFLEGLGDVDTGVVAGAFFEAHLGPAFINLSGGQDFADGHDGALIEAKLGAMIPISRKVRLIPAVTTSWASENYLQSYLGVTPAQSARSGYQPYAPEAGFKDVGATLNLMVMVSDRWALNATASYQRFVGEAADSPIVRGDGGSENQWMLMLGILRTFNF